MLTYMVKKQSFKLRRRMPRAAPHFVTVTFSLPVDLAKAMERRAVDEYGGNRSALATTAISKEIGFNGVEFIAQ